MANKRNVDLALRVEDREYKKAIAELNKENQVFASELKKVQEQYKGNESSIEALNAKSRIFEGQLASQNRKVEETRERYDAWQKELEKVKNELGENSDAYKEVQKHVQEYAIKLNNAERDQLKLEHAIEENNKAIKDQGEAMEAAGKDLVGFGDGLDDIVGKLGLDIPDGAKKALNSMGDFSLGTAAHMATAAGAIAGAVKVTHELYDLTIAQAAQADALLTRSAQTGLDTSTLQGLDYASRFVDFENADKTLAKFTQSMAAANEGTKAQAEAFDRLGVSIVDEDGHLLNNYETFLATIDALGQVENATERDAIANDLFGKSYIDMKPLVDAGTDALKSYVDEAERLGYIVDEQVIRKLGALDDAMQKNEASSTALKTTVAGELAPTFALLVDTATAAQDAFRNLMDNGFVEFITTAGMSSNPIGAFLINFKTLADMIYGVKTAQSETAETVAEDSGRMAEAIATATEAISGDLEALEERYQKAYDTALASFDGQFGLFEKADQISATSASTMMEGLQSQLNYWDTYADNLESLMGRNVEGIETFAAYFKDGSPVSASALAGFRNMTDEELQKVVNKMAQVESSKDDLAKKVRDMQVDIDGELTNVQNKYAETIENINGETENIDFAPFEDAVNTAFENMEYRVDRAVEYSTARLQELFNAANLDISPQIEQSTEWHDVGHNAAGTDSWRGGLTWVGESGPELVRLPQGTQIYSNQQSQQIVSTVGTDTRALEGLLGQAVTLLQEIRAERQAESMRGRMR